LELPDEINWEAKMDILIGLNEQLKDNYYLK